MSLYALTTRDHAFASYALQRGYSAVEKKQKTRYQAPKFGWGAVLSRQHPSIDTVAISGLPESPLKTLLSRPDIKAKIDDRSNELDRPGDEPNGLTHSLNPEFEGKRPPGQEEVRQPYVDSTARETLTRLQQFNPQNKNPFHWNRIKHYESNIPGRSGNIVINVMAAYEKLVNVLKNPNSKLDEVINAVADLLHYAGDLCHPLHLTANTSWQLQFPFEESNGFKCRTSHSFIEGEALTISPKDLQSRKIRFFPWTRRSPSHRSIQNRLVREAEASNRGVEAIVRTDLKALKDDNKSSYLKKLINGFRPAVISNAKRATILERDLLAWAYLEAGSPDLSNISMPIQTEFMAVA